MVDYYPRPTTNDTLGFLELATYTNNVAEGLVFPLLLLVIFIVVFIATKQFSTSKAFTYGAFVATILAIPLALLDLVNPKFMYAFAIMVAAGAVWLKLEAGGKPF